MFTGIVTDIGEVAAVHPHANNLHRIKISCSYPRTSIADGASISCAGICLTVTASGEDDGRTWFSVDAGPETLALTTAAHWRHGTKLNLERALKIGDELGGHLVSGHVDGIATVAERQTLPEMARFVFTAPKPLMRYIAVKGSVTLDGVSLTVNHVDADRFSVLVIPHTLKVTTFGALQTGSAVNLEVDVMARYAARLADAN